MNSRTCLLCQLLASVLALASLGCENTVYFYESERVSLTLEGKPDATEPVSGNLGIKQHLVMVLPGMDDEKEPKNSDALSVVSYFDFSKDRGTKFLQDPVDIRTAFITGKAAKGLNNLAPAALRAITRTAPEDFSELMTHLNVAYLQFLSGAWQNDPDAQALKSRLDKLESIVPARYDFVAFQWLPPNLQVHAPPALGTGYARLRAYHAELVESRNALKQALAAPANPPITVGNNPPNFSLQAEFEYQDRLLRGLQQKLATEPVVREALAYVASRLTS